MSFPTSHVSSKLMNVLIIGCGIIGATIAYELSQVKELNITVIDQQPPAQASTGAALGVLMGIISHKIKGKAWQLRETSIRRYETLIPELEQLTGEKIPCNRQGIISLCLEGEDLGKWEELIEIRHKQGWELEIWDTTKLQRICPQIENEKIIGAIYSPSDRQINPTALTLALVQAAIKNGVTFKFGVNVKDIQSQQIETTDATYAADWIVLAAGLGSTPLTAQLQQTVDIRPVLGQALHLRLPYLLGDPNFQPAITGNDVHIVPVGAGDYWVGATVEFPHDQQEIQQDTQLLESLRQQAYSFCPDLVAATTIRSWSGLRPRPEGRPAPIIGKLPGFDHILLATGHYRNGVLLAPATAIAIREMITNG